MNQRLQRVKGARSLFSCPFDSERCQSAERAGYFLAQPSNSVGGQSLGPFASTSDPYYDVALLDTGAATHILTSTASSTFGFDIDGNGFDGTNTQTVGGATGFVDMTITDLLGVYVAGLGDRTAAGAGLQMNSSVLKGQTSVAILLADDGWKLPNVVGVPIAAQHGIHIQNSDPQIFTLNDRTVRTPQIDLTTLGSVSAVGWGEAI